MRTKLRKILPLFIVLTLILSSVSVYADSGSTNKTEKREYHYVLFWGNYHTWQTTANKYDMVAPGGRVTITETYPLPDKDAKVEAVYALRKVNNTGQSADTWEKFDFEDQAHYHWNDLEWITKEKTKTNNDVYKAYEYGYENYDVKNFEYIKGSQNGNLFTYTYEYDLKTDCPAKVPGTSFGQGKILKKDQDGLLSHIQEFLGGVQNTIGTEAWKKINNIVNNKTINKTGYCYWVPYIIKYSTSASPDAEELDPNQKNLIMEKVSFLDKDKKPVSTCEKGKEYYAKYLIKYVGEDMDSKKKIVIKDLKVKDTKDGSVIYKSAERKEGEIQKKNGEEFGVTYGPFTATEDTIYACATIEYSEEISQITTDDFGEGWIDGNGEEAPTPGAITTDGAIVTPPGITGGGNGEKEDLAIKIERVTPSTTKIYAPNELAASPYNVDCVITYNATTDGNVLMTTARISVPDNQNVGKTYENEIQVNVAPGQNRISFAIPNLIVRNKSGSFNIVATVNDRHEYPKEEVTWDNNKDTIKQPISTIAQKAANPCMDPPHTVNKGKVVYQITTRTGYTYKCSTRTNADGTKSTSCGCRGGKTTHSTQTSTRTETLNLTDIHFISKQSNVNLINTKGKIKAGSGFELNITAVLTGSESPGRPSEWSSGCNGQSVSPGKFQLAQLTNRIFVVLPDGQIISNIASGPIKEQMVCSVSSNGDSFGGTVMRCKVKSGNTFGNKETNKLYVDENTKNGTYQMTVCTEKVPSVVVEGEILYDKKVVYYEVDGSYADDVFTHIIQ